MNYRDIAKLIPAKYRTEILQTNAIHNAVAAVNNPCMNYLMIIWNDYINEEDLTCNKCAGRILKNYKEILPAMVELEKEANLLKKL